MSYAIATKLLSPTELQYLELKKEHAAEKANSQTAHSSRKQRDTGIVDQVMLSSNIDPDEASKRKPSQPVTADESSSLSTYNPRQRTHRQLVTLRVKVSQYCSS